MKRPLKTTTKDMGSAVLRGLLALVLVLAHAAAVTLLSYFLGGWSACIYIPLELAALGLALKIWTEEAGGRLGWTLLLLTAPIAGFVLYVLWGDHGPRRDLVAVEPPANRTPDLKRSRIDSDRMEEILPSFSRAQTLLEKNGYLLYRDTEVTYFSGGEDFFSDMLSRIEKAEHFVFLETPNFAGGKLMDRLLEALDARARWGVAVKLIVDGRAAGSWLDHEKEELLLSRGMEIQFSSPAARTPIHRATAYRDSRSILAIDGQWAYVGSVDFTDEASGFQHRNTRRQDAAVLLDGLGAWGLTSQFLHMWEKLGGRFQTEHDYYRPMEARPAAGWCQPFGGEPGGESLSEALYLQCASAAKKTLWLMAPMFAPGDALLKALTTAADGGVDVRLLLPKTWRSRRAQRLTGAYLGQLLAHGVRVYSYTPGTICGRLLLVDGEAAVISTADLDKESFRAQYTSGVVLYGMPQIQDIRRELEGLMAESQGLEPRAFKDRTSVKKRTEQLLRALQ